MFCCFTNCNQKEKHFSTNFLKNSGWRSSAIGSISNSGQQNTLLTIHKNSLCTALFTASSEKKSLQYPLKALWFASIRFLDVVTAYILSSLGTMTHPKNYLTKGTKTGGMLFMCTKLVSYSRTDWSRRIFATRQFSNTNFAARLCNRPFRFSLIINSATFGPQSFKRWVGHESLPVFVEELPATATGWAIYLFNRCGLARKILHRSFKPVYLYARPPLLAIYLKIYLRKRPYCI